MKKNAFTLIEILIVVGSIVLVMGAISGVMFGVFSAISKNKAIAGINDSGNWVMAEIKKNIINANSDDFSCPVGVGTSIQIVNVKDGDRTTIACLGDVDSDYKIASISARGVGTTVTYLFQKNKDLKLNSCAVSCSTLPSAQLSTVNFNFNLESAVFGSPDGIGTTKTFSVDITLRNE